MYALTPATDPVAGGAGACALATAGGALAGRVADALVTGARVARGVPESDHAKQTQNWNMFFKYAIDTLYRYSLTTSWTIQM